MSDTSECYISILNRSVFNLIYPGGVQINWKKLKHLKLFLYSTVILGNNLLHMESGIVILNCFFGKKLYFSPSEAENNLAKC